MNKPKRTVGELFAEQHVLDVEGEVKLLLLPNSNLTKEEIAKRVQPTCPMNKCRIISGPCGSRVHAFILSQKFYDYLKARESGEGIYIILQQWFTKEFLEYLWPEIAAEAKAAKQKRRENRIRNKQKEIASKDRKELANITANKSVKQTTMEQRELAR